MESSRRSIDRSKEPGLKKPRLIEETERNRNLNGAVVERDRPFLQRISSDAGAETGSQLSRFKKNQRERNAERDDSVRGAYQQQPPHHELVIQYKTALAELTFNSKPIITNLTIIAGENLQAAKGIAATICANIIEVPNEQKLPSLYLLDSIVKNIGRDYIKYFGARLPEVFCKAYRQVDSSIHPAMRHLFGTWKGVFHSAPLQMIEKELGFPPTIVVPSSGRAASRPDSQTQRPPHSIHVNPKYLEARQQLQQSSKVKGTICDSPGTMFKSDDAERPDRIDGIGKGRPWDDPPVKMNNIKHSQGAVLSEPVLDKNIGAGHDTLEYDSSLSRHHQDLGISRASEGVAEQGLDKPRYVAGRNVVEPILGHHIGFDIHHGFPNRLETKSAQDVSQPESTKFISNKSSRGSFANWKDSEEEEFIWDDMNSKVTENGASDNSRREVWTPDDAEKLELADHISQSQNEHDVGSRVNSSTESLSMSQRVQIMSEQRKSSVWPLQESNFLDGLNRGSIASIDSDNAEGGPTILTGLTTSTSLPSAVTGPQRHRGPSASVSGSVETFEQQRHQPLGPASTSGKSSVLSLRQRSSSPSPIHPQKLTEQDHPQLQSFTSHGPKSSRFAEQLDRVPYLQNIPDSSSILPQSHIQLGNLRIPESNLSEHPQYLPFASASMPFPQERHHTVFSRQPQSDVKTLSGHTHELLHELSVFGTPQTKGSSTTGHLKKSSAEIQGHSSATSLLAAISQSGQFSKSPLNSSLPQLNFQELEPLNSIVQPPLPSRHPPAPSSTHKDVPVTPLYPHSYSNSSAFTTQPQIPVLHPQMPPGPPTSSTLMGSMSSQTSNTSTAIKNPLSSLLNSLAAKGLISASTMESPTPTPSQVDMNIENQSPGLSNSSPMLVTSRQVSSSQVDMNLQNQSPGLSNSSPMLVTSRQVSSAIPLSSSGNDLPPSKSVSECITNLSQGSKTETNLIGFEFKPEIIRQSHPSVISGLFQDLPFCCKICGIRFKLQEPLDRHLEWHASKKQSSLNEISRGWFVNLGDWIAGHVELPSGPSHPAFMEDSINTSEKNEKMVPADESQCVCALCGELFEDFYSHERDEWMFKGAVYMTNFDGESMGGTSDKNSAQGPIVHSNCISQNLVWNFQIGTGSD